MENNQVTLNNQPKKRYSNYFPRLQKLEKDVARLERQIDIIIKSLRR